MKIHRLRILGTRGIPANHGGFETFTEHLAKHLVSKGWNVTVYCQESGCGQLTEENWCGVRLVKIFEPKDSAFGTMRFDWKCIRHAAKEDGTVLTLGYNTALFNLWFRICGIKNVINMDGLEWKRLKWSIPARIWFYINDWAGCCIGNHLIADHPEIAKHLTTRRSKKAITMIPYGSDIIHDAPLQPILDLGLKQNQFAICIARPEPENSILEIVRAFSKKTRNQKLVILGKFTPLQNEYHDKIMNASSDQVLFPGAIYDQKIVQALRFHCSVYVHGHSVGGTNPSLVEAMGAGSPVLAHDNRFNRWVAGDNAAYFTDEHTCEKKFDELLECSDTLNLLASSGKRRHKENFQWNMILEQYEQLLLKFEK